MEECRAGNSGLPMAKWLKIILCKLMAKRRDFFLHLGSSLVSHGFAPHPLRVLAFYHVLKEKVGDYSWSRF